MKDRVAALVGRSIEGWWLGTFHALAARLVREEAERIGLKPNFTILDTDDQLRLLKQILEAERIDDKKWPARMILAVIQRWKDRALTPEKVKAGEAGDLAGGRAVKLYAAYQERLLTLNACDFGDLLLHSLTLLQDHPDVLAKAHQRFRYILVDEYQDTNVAQYLWLRLLAQGHGNLCCVGDDDQSIYGWRGAEVGNILRFEQDMPGARVIRLERNYRSTGHILAVASGLIAKNSGRLGKTLWTAAEEGEAVRLRGLWDGEAEARFVGEEIEALQRTGPRAVPDRHPGADRRPDPGVRGALHHPGPALPDRRRGRLLRAHGDPRRARLSPDPAPARRQPGVRAHRQQAQARARRRHAAGASRPCPRPADRLGPGRARGGRDRRAAPGGAPLPGRFADLARALARAGATRPITPSWPRSCSRSRAIPRCG